MQISDLIEQMRFKSWFYRAQTQCSRLRHLTGVVKNQQNPYLFYNEVHNLLALQNTKRNEVQHACSSNQQRAAHFA